MSQLSNSKGKDAGRKYASLNLNQTFKGTKAENKPTTGQNTRHGLQSLGKVSSRRAPVPANLPSLKSENSGNDPRINLVPTGAPGWGKKENPIQNGKQRETQPTGVLPGQIKTKPGDTLEVSLRPNAGAVPASKPQPGIVEGQDGSKVTWKSKVQPEQPATGTSPYFQKEFPRLGLDGNLAEDGRERGRTEEGGPDANHPGMGHPARPNQMPPNFQNYGGGDRPMFNNTQQPYPYPYPPMYHSQGGRMPMPPYPYPYPYGGPGGKMPQFDPRFFQRMPKPQFMNNSNSSTDRPSVIKDSDLKSLDADKDDAGWAGSQEEVDYNAKLKFDESDSDEDSSTPRSSKKQSDRDQTDGESKQDEKGKNQGKQQWEFPGYPPMQMPYGQNWPRFPPYDPQRGPPPYGYPVHPMFFMSGGFPPNMAQMGGEKTEDTHKQGEKKDDGKDTHSHGTEHLGAREAKLKEIEERMRKRTEEERKKEDEKSKKQRWENHDSYLNRPRKEGEVLGSSRREVPPRFRQHGDKHDRAHENKQGTPDSSHMRIMQRKDSVKSDEEGLREDVFEKEDKTKDASSTSSRKDNEKGSRQQRLSSSSETREKEKSSRHSSSSSIKDAHKKDSVEKLHGKKELKDLSESKKRDKDNDKHLKDRDRRKPDPFDDKYDDNDGKSKSNDALTINSQRFAENKLTKGQSKHAKVTPESEKKTAAQNKEKFEPKKASAWSKVVSGGEVSAKENVEQGKSLREIQKEEEEEENKKSKVEVKSVEAVDSPNLSPDENKFRSDNDKYVERRNRNDDRQRRDDKYDNKSRPERRGRFDEANRRGGRIDRGDHDYKRDNRYNRDDGRKDRYDDKEGSRKYSNRREDRKEDRRDGHYKDYKSDAHKKDDGYHKRGERKEYKADGNRKEEDYHKKTETKEYVKEEEKFSDSRAEKKDDKDYKRDSKKDEFKKEESKDDRKERKNDWKDYKKDDSRRYDKKDRHRSDYDKRDQGREPQRDGERKRDDRKAHYAEDKRREDQRSERREHNRPERNASRKHSDRKDYHEEKQYGSSRKGREWDNRDYRQSEEYKRENREKKEKKLSETKEELAISKAEQTSTKQPAVSKGEQTATKEEQLNTKVKQMSLKEEIGTTDKSLDETVRKLEKVIVVDSKIDAEKQEEGKVAVETASEEKKEKNTGGFGAPDKNKETRSRSDRNDRYDDSRSYRGDRYDDSRSYRGSGARERGRGRGRGFSNRGSAGSSRSQGLSSSSRRDKNKYRDNYRNSKDEYYEDVSSGDLTDEDTPEQDKARTKSSVHSKSKKPESKRTWDEDTPPRFQNRYDGRDRGSSRGRGVNFRGRGRGAERGRGRGRGRGSSSSFGSRNVGTGDKPHDEDKAGDDSEDYYSAEESPGHKESKYDKDKYSSERRPRSHHSYRPDSKSRGNSATAGRIKSSSFLSKRQQIGNNRTSDGHKTPTAADKYHPHASEVHTQFKGDIHTQFKGDMASKNPLNLEDISAHSPPKKSKPLPEKREEKKRDIALEYDLNNIRSVVCIDDFETTEDHSKTTWEDDGFVTVTSKKQQKELREAEKKKREEEKKKLYYEQKREAQKAVRNNSHKNSAASNVRTKAVVSSDPPVSIVSPEQTVVSSAPVHSQVSAPAPASNAAMAAIGVWEPAQSLMKSHSSTNTSADGKTIPAPVSNVNAWQRPLTLNASSGGMPDPRAVGTGKPSSSHSGMISKAALVPTQPTPEAASPLVTPPALTPINRTSISELEISVIKTEQSKVEPHSDSIKKADKATNDEDGEKSKRRDRNDGRRDTKLINKRILRERPPRFQTSQRKESNEDRSKNYDDSRKQTLSTRQSNYENKSRKRSADRQRKAESSTKVTQETKTGNTRASEGSLHEETDNVFTSEVAKTSDVDEYRCKLSDADKVVGSNKPSLKSQSSVGSYTSSDHPIEEVLVEVNLTDSYQAPTLENELFSGAEDKHSVAKSANDEERSLETRSLPGSPPPLAVKIPEPTLSGPSSDPGRGPSPGLTKSPPNMSQEMTDLNLRLFNARTVWDNPSMNWSESSASSAVTAHVSSLTSVANISDQSMDKNMPGSPTKRDSSTAPSVDVPKKSEEKSSSVPSFGKRSEQQICKVKPQQQLPSDDTKGFQVSSHQTLTSSRNNIAPTTKYASYILPVERQLQQNTLYATDYNDQLRSQAGQALNFQSLNQVRSVDASVSPMSQQLLSSFPAAGSIYNTALQGSQNQMLAWQVVSTPSVQPKTIAAYPTGSPGSLFTSAGSISNSQFILPYGTNFQAQRTASNLQRQQVGMVQVQQPQHQSSQHARVVGMMSANNASQLHHNQQYGLRSTSDPHLNNTSHITLMLDPTSVISQSQQLSSQQRSDLMKHVHAKPFEPTSQTPPLIQSPPIAQQQLQPHRQQQQIITTVFGQSNTARSNYVQNMRYSQPLLHQRQHNVQPIQQPSPLVAPIRPRTVQGHAPPTDNSSIGLGHQDPVINTFDQGTLGIFANSMALKNRPILHNNGMQMQINPRVMNNQYNHVINPAQLRNGPRVQNAVQNRTNGPGPIQRPVQGHNQPLLMHPVPKQHITSTSAADADFKKIQRQKMLQDTKRYFAQEQNPEKIVEKSVKEEKPVSSSTDSSLAKHDKYILPDQHNDSKKSDYNKKGSRSSNADQYKGRNRKNVTSVKNGASSGTKKADGSTPSQQNKRPSEKI